MALTERGRERLQTLVRHVAHRVSDTHFIMKQWFVYGRYARQDLGLSDDDCGTAGCMMGHACDIKELGLTKAHGYPQFKVEERPDGLMGQAAAKEVFDLSYDQAAWLFGQFLHLDRSRTLERFQLFLNKDGELGDLPEDSLHGEEE